MTERMLAEQIDALLPQTQCAKCGYSACMPYAEAIAAGEADINQCPPGGEALIRKLARLLRREEKRLNPVNGAERRRTVARIDEARCIGCTLCIRACPVDAIVGAARCMHTVIAELCTGCDLCVPPCPVDCIAMLPLPDAQAPWTQDMAGAARARFRFRRLRLERDLAERAERLARKAQEKRLQPMPEAKKAIILAALERAKARKAGVAPRSTDELPSQVRAEIAAVDAHHAAAKKR
ncbi:MAG: electron transport complex subunit RsxB [Betaproteobacteria bacterium]|nr:electron transport complex subunit RsxB [Betaproteobacteria bacterium]